MDKEEARVMAEFVDYVDLKFEKAEKRIQHALDKIKKQDESIQFLFKELAKKSDLIDAHGKKLCELSSVDKELVNEISNFREELIELEDDFFEKNIVDDVEKEVQMSEEESTKKVQGGKREKKVLTKEMVEGMRYDRVRSIARRKLGCPYHNKDTQYYKDFIIEHKLFQEGKVMI